MNKKKEEINLGGFPPIIVIDKKIKSIKEFSNNIKIKDESKNLLNVFNIKNILNSVKK
jgi:hypothetical protein